MPWTKDETKAKIYYEIIRNGPAIVFIHPPGMGHLTYRGQKEGLKKHFTIITVDLRGTGRSENGDRELSMSLLAEDIVRVLDECNVQSAYICSYSNGGSVALQLAISFPNRVRGIALIGGFPEVNSFLLRNQFRIGIYVSGKNMMNLIANILAFAHEKTKKERQELANYIKRISPNILKKYYEAGLKYKATNSLHKITCPVLLIYGERDDYVHHYRHIFRQNVKGPLSIILVGDTAHQIPTKKVSALNQILKDFITSNDEQKEKLASPTR